ncbi:hypothetical protein SAMN05216223_104324 [Actinacidiphila yanglinensis]|uniref:Uncharacterized protein n=1 Tax=Actinacidiphila yanglinensis TaxID=310779 RepID=A0A1H5Z5N1_9ACTN|nr:hypothetical protein [Actinacidiphila yanglinensis]SEG31641.1 hypothetical protein SAMN05216223_104324 [Actinacidiphila yanglinensis]
MSTSTVSPGPAFHGSSALGSGEGQPRHVLGNALRAVKVFVTAAVDVVILGSESARH